MSESNSSIGASFIFVGAEQPQVFLPSRPQSLRTQPFRRVMITILTSPIDSNSSSVGTLEPTNHPSTDPAYIVGSSLSYAHDWSRGTTGRIRTHGRHFVDGYGRCNLRGVNLSENCQNPVNDDHTTFPAGAETVAFVGRPFPLDEAQHPTSKSGWALKRSKTPLNGLKWP